MSTPPEVPLPDVDLATPVIAAPGDGPGYWAGAPSAVLRDGVWWLAYRLRRPVGLGRGVAVELARSDDGVRFVAVARVEANLFEAESLERPALVARPDGGWRLYVSCATPGTKHWRIEALDADTVDKLPYATPITVLAGDAETGVKDPVVRVDGNRWSMWVCCHPLDVPGAEDRMVSRRAHSRDGLTWVFDDVVLAPPADGWARRGTRVTAVIGTAATGLGQVLYFDGRASAEENWFERTGVAAADAAGVHRPIGTAPAAQSPYDGHALRYLDVVALPDGGYRLFFEASRPDGAHDCYTQVVAAVDLVVPGSA